MNVKNVEKLLGILIIVFSALVFCAQPAKAIDYPNISGPANIAITDQQTAQPFYWIMIDDNTGYGVQVSITFPAANGKLSGPGLTVSDGVYDLRGDYLAQTNSRMQSLVFTPTQNQTVLGGIIDTTFTVTVTNASNFTATSSAFHVYATSVNDAPSDIHLSNSVVAPDAGTNAVVGSLSTTDPDPSDSHIYALVSGVGDTHNALFNISGNELRANDTSAMTEGFFYSVRVRSTDSQGASTSKKMWIGVGVPALYPEISNVCSGEYVFSITRVIIGTIDNISAGPVTSAGYSDYTYNGQTTDLVAASTEPITIQFASSDVDSWTGNAAVFFDWNHDGDFTDADEGIVISSGYTVGYPYVANVTVPGGAKPGPTRMRIIVNNEYDNPFTTAANGQTCKGEVEDYIVNVVALPPSVASQAPSGLVSWWAANGDATDAAGTNNGAFDVPAYVTGYSGQAFSFNGSNRIRIEDSASLHPAQFSASLWFNWDNVGTSNVEFLLAKGLTHYELHLGGGAGVNGIRFIPAGNPATTVDAASAVTSGWNHVVVTYSGSEAYIYVNGTLKGSRTGITGGADLTADTSPLLLGKRGDSTYYYHGKMDEALFFNRVLSASEISAIYNAKTASIRTAAAAAPGTPSIVHGAVNDNGPDTAVKFEYGTTTGYGSTTAATPATVTGGSGVTAVSASLSGLLPFTFYHFRIRAENAGGVTYGQDQTFTTPLASTTTTLVSDTNPSVDSQTVTFTATVTPADATGSVTFMDGTKPIGGGGLYSGVAIFDISVLFPGSHTITAVYSGGGTYSGSTSTSLIQVVKKLTATNISADYNPSVTGQLVTFTARVTLTEATGTVTFMDGVTLLGTGDITNGVATFSTSTLSAGSHTISAIYSGDKDCNGSNSSLTLTVNPVIWQLSASVTGSGDGTITSSPQGTGPVGVSCMKTSGSCTTTFPDLTPVKLTANPDPISVFDKWGGNCGGNTDCSITMEGDRNVTATFILAMAINNTTATPYATLGEALTAANAVVVEELLLLGMPYNGAVSLDKGVILNGGWNSTYLAKGSPWTTLNDGLTVQNGASILVTTQVKQQLVIQGGSLQVEGLTILP